MRFKFEKFTAVDVSFAARVTIRQRTGQIGFSNGAINRFSLQNVDYVVLYYDNENRVVGIEPMKEKVEGAIEVRKKPSNNYFSAKNFLDKYGIDYRESHRYELKKDTQTGFLYFELGTDVDEPDDSDPNDLDDVEDDV